MVESTQVNYSNVESEEVYLDDLKHNPQRFIVLDLETIIICNKCHKRLTWKKTEKYINERCGCGCRIYYPKNDKNVVVSTFIKQSGGDNNGRKYSTSTND